MVYFNTVEFATLHSNVFKFSERRARPRRIFSFCTIEKVSRVIHLSKKEGRGMSPPLFFYLKRGVKLVISIQPPFIDVVEFQSCMELCAF